MRSQKGRHEAECSLDYGRQGLSQVVVGDFKLLVTQVRWRLAIVPCGVVSHLGQGCQIILGLCQLSIFLGRPRRFAVEFVDLVLGLLDIKPLVLPLLYGLAYGGDVLSGVVRRLDNSRLDRGDVLGELCPQVRVDVLKGEGPVELEIWGDGSLATVAVGCANYRVVEARIDVGDLELRIN